MFSPSHHKTSHPLQLFPSSSNSAPPSSTLSSNMKLKNLIHTLILSHMCRIIRTLSKVKTVILDILKRNQSDNNIHFPNKKHTKISKKIIFGSFRLHYNWCSSKSSHVIPVPSRIFDGLLPKASANYDDVIGSEEKLHGGDDFHDDSQLAGYLQWLEEKVHDDDEINEIDMLAEMFIANCHEKFKLEKQESDRRFQEMLARGM